MDQDEENGLARGADQPYQNLLGQKPQAVVSVSWSVLIHYLGLSLILLIIWCVSAQAQEPFGLSPSSRPHLVEPTLPKVLPPAPLTRPELPPVPRVSPNMPSSLTQARVWVHRIRIEGNTIFSDQILSQVTQAYLNRYVTSEDLEELRRDLTRLYTNRGYINSGAILPDQTIANGEVTLRIIEGTLSEITFSGKHWFRDSYLLRRLTLDLEPPLNVNVLRDRIRRLQQDERIERLNAELLPGVRRGESELHVELLERTPYRVKLEFNNYQSPSVGAERGLITVAHDNVTGSGDRWHVTYGRSEGLDLQVDTLYTIPLSLRGTTISLRYGRNQSTVIAEAFTLLDIESRSEMWELSFRRPFYRDERREFALTLSGKRAHSKTFLGGEPESLSAGVRKGVANVTTLTLSSEWRDQAPNSVLAMQSRITVGVDAFGATINRSGTPTGDFLSWRGQFQWLRRFGPHDLRFLFRFTTQLTTKPLLSLEQLSIGGRFSVRGYRENRLIRDNGLLVSMELRIPIVRQTRWAEMLQMVPFVDFGRGWNRNVLTPGPKNLFSLGLGLQWALTLRPLPLRVQVEGWWGQKLLHRTSRGGNLQDKGVHFQVVLSST